MTQSKLVIGMDFGTDSARGILVDAISGEVLKTAISYFSRWKKGLYCEPEKDQYRQHPLDYTEAIDNVFQRLFEGNNFAKNVAAIATNTTGSTPVAVDENCNPLALTEGFEENPNAMFVLWKDHTAIKEAEEINTLARSWQVDFIKYSGGIYSSEWFWSKILFINRNDAAVSDKAYTWVEQSDWIPAYLSGIAKPHEIKRNRCAAGHKAMWNEEFGGLPSQEFLNTLDSSFKKLEGRFYTETYTADQILGKVSDYFIERFGFSPDTIVTVGAIDAHHGAVGSGIEPYTMVKVVGTSTCDMLVVPKGDSPPLVNGICGQVDGSIDPDMIGFEAGQSAFGDIYNWFKKMILKPVNAILNNPEIEKQLDEQLFAYLNTEAAKLPVTECDLVFTDYHNGRRTPDADFSVEASAYGFNLSTQAAHVFKALVEATAFGSRAIMERFVANNIPIKAVIATGGIPSKSPYVVQVLSDIMGVEIGVVDSEQTCALGSAIFAATACGVYANVQEAKKAIAAKVVKTYTPNLKNRAAYETLYKRYKELTLTHNL